MKTMDHNLLDLQKGCAGELGLVGALGIQAPGSGVFFSSKCSKQEFKAFQCSVSFWAEDICADLPLCVCGLLFVLSKCQLAPGIRAQSRAVKARAPFGWAP